MGRLLIGNWHTHTDWCTMWCFHADRRWNDANLILWNEFLPLWSSDYSYRSSWNAEFLSYESVDRMVSGSKSTTFDNDVSYYLHLEICVFLFFHYCIVKYKSNGQYQGNWMSGNWIELATNMRVKWRCSFWGWIFFFGSSVLTHTLNIGTIYI